MSDGRLRRLVGSRARFSRPLDHDHVTAGTGAGQEPIARSFPRRFSRMDMCLIGRKVQAILWFKFGLWAYALCMARPGISCGQLKEGVE